MRFSGFDDEWKSCRFDELFDFQVAGDMKKELFNEEFIDEYKYPLYANALENEGLLGYYKEYKYNPNSITVTARGNIGHATARKNKFNAVGRLIILTPKEDLNIEFFTEYINNNVKIYIESTGVPQLTAPSLKINKLHYPTLNEQNKISNLLIMLNNKIELLGQKHQLYQYFKKYLMQQIFTQKLRFDDNCQYKTKQVKDFLIESKIEGIDDINKRLTVKLNLKGITVRESKTIEIEGATKQFIRKTGQFIYGKQNLHKGAFGIIPKELDGYLTSSDIPSFDFKGGIEPKWFYYYFARKSFYEKLENLSTGTGSKRISPKEFLNIKIIVPEFKEQHKIVCLLEKFDEKINGISNQIVQMNMFKKSLLQQMFVVQLILSLLQNKKHI